MNCDYCANPLYQKLKKFGVFEKFGHVTYLQIYNLQIYDVLNELDNRPQI